MSDYFEVDLYVCGVYRGKRKVGKNSICGALLSGDLAGGLAKTSEMIESLNEIEGVQASGGLVVSEERKDTDENGICY